MESFYMPPLHPLSLNSQKSICKQLKNVIALINTECSRHEPEQKCSLHLTKSTIMTMYTLVHVTFQQMLYLKKICC